MGGKYPPGEKRAQESGGQVYTLHSGLMGGSPCSDRAGHLGIAPVYRSHLHLLHYCGECPPTPTRRGAPCPLSGRDCGQAHPLPTFPSSGGSLCPNWAYFLIFIMKGDLKGLLLKVQGQSSFRHGWIQGLQQSPLGPSPISRDLISSRLPSLLASFQQQVSSNFRMGWLKSLKGSVWLALVFCEG